jgi:phosphonate transport system substrate-binding protein
MKLVRTSVAALLALLMLAGPAFAQFMLDSRFTDADGDLIADIPTDESQLVDPDTLIFA